MLYREWAVSYILKWKKYHSCSDTVKRTLQQQVAQETLLITTVLLWLQISKIQIN